MSSTKKMKRFTNGRSLLIQILFRQKKHCRRLSNEKSISVVLVVNSRLASSSVKRSSFINVCRIDFDKWAVRIQWNVRKRETWSPGPFRFDIKSIWLVKNKWAMSNKDCGCITSDISNTSEVHWRSSSSIYIHAGSRTNESVPVFEMRGRA